MERRVKGVRLPPALRIQRFERSQRRGVGLIGETLMDSYARLMRKLDEIVNAGFAAAPRRIAAVFVVDEMTMESIFHEARVLRIVAVDARPMRVVVGEQGSAAGLLMPYSLGS